MLPTDETITELADEMGAGGIIIDGGNTNYKDGLRLYEVCKSKGVSLIDAGTSGGVWGLKEGYCLMVGGDDEQVSHCEPIFLTLAPPKGYAHVGPAGAGHFSKMVHNGIEYGLLQAYGEGFEILKDSPYPYDLGQLAELWCHGSVVRSWLLELLVLAFREDPGFGRDPRLRGRHRRRALDGGSGDRRKRAGARSSRSRCSRAWLRDRDESFSAKVVAALRNQFGGHAVKSETNG